MQPTFGNKTLLTLSLVLAVFTVAIAIFSIRVNQATALNKESNQNFEPLPKGSMFLESIPRHLVTTLSY